MTNSTLKQEQSPVGGDCYHTIYLNCKTDSFFMLIVGAMAIAPYPPVGRVVLIPTQAQTTNKFNRSNKNQYANIFDLIKAFYFADFCRDEDNPTYSNKGKN